MNRLPNEVLTDYAHQFYGFGSWKAGVWFVGVEEEGGATFDDVASRLRAWDERGRKDLENAPAFYPACGTQSWHGDSAKIHPTWKQLIRMLLLAQGERDSEKGILTYQRTHLGGAQIEACLMDLLPLPSPSTADWAYDDWSDLEWLGSRMLYMKELKSARISQLKQHVTEHRPRVVIFYGTTLPEGNSLLPVWVNIAGGKRFEQAIENRRILMSQQNEHTQFFLTRHPAVEGDNYFREIGRFLHKEYAELFTSG